jgi:diacylglycerol kinase (ATP)
MTQAPTELIGPVIFNPNAGSAEEIDAVKEALRGHAGLRLEPTDHEGHPAELAEQAARDGASVVVAAGGDGTVNEIVCGLMQARKAGVDELPAVAIAPLGTGNDFARTLGVHDLTTVQAIERLDTFQACPLDIIAWQMDTDDVRREGFAVNALAGGFSSQLQASLTKDLKKTWGPFAYVRAAFEEFGRLESYGLTFCIDGGPSQKVEVLNVVIANGRFAGGGIEVAPPARTGDGRLDLLIIQPGPMLDVASLGPALLSGTIDEADLTIHVPGEKFVLEATPPIPFNIDGDRLASGRLEANVVPHALRVLCPT